MKGKWYLVKGRDGEPLGVAFVKDYTKRYGDIDVRTRVIGHQDTTWTEIPESEVETYQAFGLELPTLRRVDTKHVRLHIEKPAPTEDVVSIQVAYSVPGETYPFEETHRVTLSGNLMKI